MINWQPERMKEKFIDFRLEEMKVFRGCFAYSFQHCICILSPIFNLGIENFQFFELLSVYIQLSSFFDQLFQGIEADFGMRIPEEVAKRLFFVESFASNTLPSDITFGLMFFDSKTFNVEPLSTLVFTLNHDRVFIRNTIPANTVFLRVVYLNQLSWNFSI